MIDKIHVWLLPWSVNAKPVLVAQSVVSKSVQGSKNIVSTQNKLGHSTYKLKTHTDNNYVFVHKISYRILHCKNRLVVLTTEWLPWLHVLVW